MSNEQNKPQQKMSRRQRAKLRHQEREDKGLFMSSGNNPSGVDFFQQLIQIFSTDARILELIERNSVLSTSIDLISTIASSLELNLYKRQKTGDFVPYRGVRHIDHQLSKPNQLNTKTTFIYDIVQNILAFGHVYIVKASKEYYVFQPREISPEYRNGTLIAYRLLAVNKEVAVSQVLHICRPGLNRKVYWSPTKAVVAETILGNDILKQITNHVRSGMLAKGVLKQDAAGNSALSQNQMDALAKQFSAATSGERASGTIMLPKGISYEAFAQTVADSALTDTYGIARKNILQAFKIPESIYTAEATSFASANVQEIAFLKNAIKPLCVLIQDAFNGWSQLTNEQEYFQFEMGDLVSQEEEKAKADTAQVKATTAQTLSQLSASGKKLYSPNEIREASGHGKITDDGGALVDEADDNPFNAPETTPESEVQDEELDNQEDDVIKSVGDVVEHKGCKHHG